MKSMFSCPGEYCIIEDIDLKKVLPEFHLEHLLKMRKKADMQGDYHGSAMDPINKPKILPKLSTV